MVNPPAPPDKLRAYGGNITGNFPGNKVRKNQREMVHEELRECAFRGLAGGYPPSNRKGIKDLSVRPGQDDKSGLRALQAMRNLG